MLRAPTIEFHSKDDDQNEHDTRRTMRRSTTMRRSNAGDLKLDPSRMRRAAIARLTQRLKDGVVESKAVLVRCPAQRGVPVQPSAGSLPPLGAASVLLRASCLLLAAARCCSLLLAAARRC